MKRILIVLFVLVLLGTTAWAQAPSPKATAEDLGAASADGVVRISVEQLKTRLDKSEVVVVDVRAICSSTIKGALHIPLAEIEKHLSDLPKDKLIVTSCAWANEASSARAALILQKNGYTKVAALKGGMAAWEEAKYPTEPIKSDQ